MVRRLAILVLLTLGGYFVLQAYQPIKPIQLHGQTMGTTYNISYLPHDDLPEPDALQQQIDQLLEQVNDQMSTYRPDSELSRFNQLGEGLALPMSAETIRVLEASIALSQQTQGALDITLGPLVNLWGFGPQAKPTTVPSAELVAATKRNTGLSGFEIDRQQVRKLNPELYLDLSAIAKGFGVDQVAALLDRYQVNGYLVEIGGELITKGKKADDSNWRIAIEQPSAEARAVQLVIEPQNMAVATSGDYRNYYEEQGQRFSHLIDPRTGYPIQHQLASVTVVDPSCMMADGYATAMMVMGTEQALALANELQLAVMLIEKQPQGFEVVYSQQFETLFINNLDH